MDAYTFADRDGLEMLRSAQINFENLVTISPVIAGNPIYVLAKAQLDAAVLKFTPRGDAGPDAMGNWG